MAVVTNMSYGLEFTYAYEYVLYINAKFHDISSMIFSKEVKKKSTDLVGWICGGEFWSMSAQSHINPILSKSSKYFDTQNSVLCT